LFELAVLTLVRVSLLELVDCLNPISTGMIMSRSTPRRPLCLKRVQLIPRESASPLADRVMTYHLLTLPYSRDRSTTKYSHSQRVLIVDRLYLTRTLHILTLHNFTYITQCSPVTSSLLLVLPLVRSGPLKSCPFVDSRVNPSLPLLLR
jgi:hypothetical protein